MKTELEMLLEDMAAPSASLSEEDACMIAYETFGLQAHAKKLTGERDENFRIISDDGDYVLKVGPPLEDHDITDLSSQALLHLENTAPDLPCPRILPARDGRWITVIADAEGRSRNVRLLTYLPGRPLFETSRSGVQRAQCGQLAAALTLALRDFRHPAAHRPLVWDLQHAPKLAPLVDLLDDAGQRRFAAEFLDTHSETIQPVLTRARHQLVHNDLNARNLLVSEDQPDRITGIIDFGDIVHSAIVADAAIAASGQIVEGAQDRAICEFLDGYQSVAPLTADELGIFPDLIAARIVSDVLIMAWHKSRRPGNPHHARLTPDYAERRLKIARAILSGEVRSVILAGATPS